MGPYGLWGGAWLFGDWFPPWGWALAPQPSEVVHLSLRGR